MKFVSHVVATGVVLWIASALHAGPRSAAVREAIEVVAEKFGKDAVRAAGHGLSGRLERLAALHGDEVLTAFRKTGPASLHLLELSGDEAASIARVLARHGDEAVWVMAEPARRAIALKSGDAGVRTVLKHRQLGERLLVQIPRSAPALERISVQNGQRLAILAEEGFLTPARRPEAFMAVLARHGDVAMELVWKHRVALSAAAVWIAFLNDPEAFLDGTGRLVDSHGRVTAPPLNAAGERVADRLLLPLLYVASAVLAACCMGRRLASWVSWGLVGRKTSASRPSACAVPPTPAVASIVDTGKKNEKFVIETSAASSD